MRKLLLLTFILASFSMNAQDSKFYAGVGVGYATAGGEVADEFRPSWWTKHKLP